MDQRVAPDDRRREPAFGRHIPNAGSEGGSDGIHRWRRSAPSGPQNAQIGMGRVGCGRPSIELIRSGAGH
eukprot:14081809-Heterocapsa_arctica.AAC.1